MRRDTAVRIATALAVAAGLTFAGAPVGASPHHTPDPTSGRASARTAAGPTVFVGDLTLQQLGALRRAGFDREDLSTHRLRGAAAAAGKVGVELLASRAAAAKLVAQGLPLAEKRVGGERVSARIAKAAAPTVYRSYSEPGGIRDELVRTARQHPRLTKLESIGRTVRGQRIYAIKVTAGARHVPDGRRPAVLYSAAQHAREWITPEMDRRLLHHVLDHAREPRFRTLLRTTELWFVPVANPDGYDFTFTPGNRFWRKNLRDNNHDGRITDNDGVDPNRNFPTKWGYDNEGSSPSFGSPTYRGAAPESEPETRALDGLMRRVRFAFQVNYHSAAELLLYGVGWQVLTPSPDDVLFEAQAGDDAHPAVPGYDPDQSAELYTTNGETTEHAHDRYGTLAYTPEMSTCQTASAVDPNDAFDPADCESVFSFPDSEPLVRGEFRKNLPFALAVAESATHPSHPVSPVGRRAPDFRVDSFDVSYGDPQTVAVTARKELRHLVVRWSVDGGRVHTAGTRFWRGGERYGDEGTAYYGEFRGQVHGARPGDRVRVWFRAVGPHGGRRTSPSFTYRLAEDTDHTVVVIADEDYNGVNPTYDPPLTAPKYAGAYVRALRRAGIGASVWDVSKRGAPHPLGVLSHFRGAVWYLGDNRLTQDPEDELTDFGSDQLPDAQIAEREEQLTIAVRDFLNEGGKLVHTGETATYYGLLGADLGGIYYGLNGDPSADCAVTEDPFSDCLLLTDDFAQYYLGRYARHTVDGPTGVAWNGSPDASGYFGGPAVRANPVDEAGLFPATSSVLPRREFPQFASATAGRYRGGAGGARFAPASGARYVGGLHVDDSYMRLTRTVDLTGVTAAQKPALQASLSFDLEPGYDHVLVEAHTVGSDDWTTLADTGGLTSTTVPSECEAGFLLDEHPFLTHYLTGGATCSATGSTGSWNAMTGDSGGWRHASFDLSGFAGKRVEVSVAQVTDPAGGGTGAFVDDTRLVVGGATRDAEGFETGLGPWTIAGPPPGSSPHTGRFVRSPRLFAPVVTTPDTVLLGYGVEQVASPADRTAVLARAFRTVGLAR